MNRTVSLRACPDYDQAKVFSAVKTAWESADSPDVAGKSVLLKPNLVKGANPEEAVSTHPEVLRAVIRLVKEKGAGRVIVGESPGFQGFEQAARKSGLIEVIESEGVEFDAFTTSVIVDNPEGALIKDFKIAKAALAADVLVCLPKLKTHTLLQFSGAIKNLFGCVPGFDKAAYHCRFPDKENFGQVLVDLAIYLAADFAVMDAIVGMEGPGPGNGDPRHIGQILASSNLLALDRVACRLVGYDPDGIDYLKKAFDSGYWLKPGEEAEIKGGNIGEAAIPDFKIVQEGYFVGFQKGLPPFMRAILSRFVKKPYFRNGRCIRCSGCVKICPPQALTLIDRDLEANKPGKIHIDRVKCIRCYCCHEVCPADAIALRKI